MVFLIRFFTGYVRFAVSGSRPGRIVNELLRSGINVWGVTAHSGEITCCVSRADYPAVQELCRGTSRRVHIKAKRGLPFIMSKHRRRSGLAVGLLCYIVIFRVLSLFIWNVEICEFDTMSRASVTETLGRVGIYEGVRSDFESLKRMQTSAMIEFGNLSWITINADGSRAEVNATEKLPAVENDDSPRNIKASIDGQIIRADVYKGTAAVRSGDAVVRGDLLISGVVENASGSVRFERAAGVVTARTRYLERFEIPKTHRAAVWRDTNEMRYSCGIFSAEIPIGFTAYGEGRIALTSRSEARFLGESTKASLTTQRLYSVEVAETQLDQAAAQSLFSAKMILRELFRYSGKKITSRSTNVYFDGGKYNFETSYTCEEDISAPSPIRIDSDID